eukprot:361204-Chlamydomonas_euryale.AAC.1
MPPAGQLLGDGLKRWMLGFLKSSKEKQPMQLGSKPSQQLSAQHRFGLRSLGNRRRGRGRRTRPSTRCTSLVVAARCGMRHAACAVACGRCCREGRHRWTPMDGGWKRSAGSSWVRTRGCLPAGVGITASRAAR